MHRALAQKNSVDIWTWINNHESWKIDENS